MKKLFIFGSFVLVAFPIGEIVWSGAGLVDGTFLWLDGFQVGPAVLGPLVGIVNGSAVLPWVSQAENVEMLLLKQKGIIDPNHVSKGYSALHLGIIRQDLKSVQLLLDNGADVNVRGELDRTPLHWAASKNSLPMVNLLLEKGGDPKLEDIQGRTPFHSALEHLNQKMMAKFIETGCDVNKKRGLAKETSLATVISRKPDISMVNMLIDHGADVHTLDAFNNTLLHIASSRGASLETIKLLIENGVDPKLKNEDSVSPVQLAAIAGREEIVEYLLSNGGSGEDTPLHYLMAKQDLDHEKFVGMLVKAGANVDEPNYNDNARYPLHYALLIKKSEPVLRILLENGADPNNKDGSQLSPLHYATMRNQFNLVEILLEFNADLEGENKLKQTPIFNTCPRTGDVAITKLLLAKGANVNHVDKIQRSPLAFAVANENYDVVKVLLENGADVNQRGRHGITPFLVNVYAAPNTEILKLFLERDDLDVNVKNYRNDRTALHLAISKGNVNVVKILLEHPQILINPKDDEGVTPFQLAIEERLPEIVESLIEKKIDVKEKLTKTGETALHLVNIATKNIAKILLDAGADINAIDDDGFTPLARAVANSDKAITPTLVNKLQDLIGFFLQQGADPTILPKQARKLVDLAKNKHIVKYLFEYFEKSEL